MITSLRAGCVFDLTEKQIISFIVLESPEANILSETNDLISTVWFYLYSLKLCLDIKQNGRILCEVLLLLTIDMVTKEIFAIVLYAAFHL